MVCTVQLRDMENDPCIAAMIGASAALTPSGIPFWAHRAGRSVDRRNYVLNPILDNLPQSQLDLVVAGTGQGVLMVESEASELSEEIMLGAVTFGHEQMQPVIDLIISLAEVAAKEPWAVAEEPPAKGEVYQSLKSQFGDALAAAYANADKVKRHEAIAAVRAEALESLGEDEEKLAVFPGVFKNLESDVVRGQILDGKPRIDGRDTKTVRPIVSETGVLPRAHGSALFTRGETQALVTDRGTGQDEQIIDALEGEYRQHFMLHYNFPPYSVGEAGRMGFQGAGNRARQAGLPRDSPAAPARRTSLHYSRRFGDHQSNGSSSMATVCGTSLALMDAGVPLARPVAGIAMGLIKEGDNYAVISTSWVTRITWETWTSCSRYGNWHYRTADGHQDHFDYEGDHGHRAAAGQRRPAPHSRRDGQDHGRGLVKAWRPIHRGSPPSASPRRRSAKSSEPAARSSGRSVRQLAKVDIEDDGYDQGCGGRSVGHAGGDRLDHFHRGRAGSRQDL